VSREAAVRALEKFAETGDAGALEKLTRLLLRDPSIRERIDEVDVEAAVERATVEVAAGGEPAAALGTLESELSSAPETTLVAVFPGVAVSSAVAIGCVEFAPASTVFAKPGLALASGAPLPDFTKQEALAVRVNEPAAGSKGRRRALLRLRAAVGALYLCARLHGAGDRRLGPIPADDRAPALFVGPAGDLACLVQVMRFSPSFPLDIDGLLKLPAAMSLMADCLDPGPADFVSQRLRDCAPWIEVAFDALAYADAVLSLGVALEVLLGSESQHEEVVKLVSKRVAFLFREGRSRDQRLLTAAEWRDRARRLYGQRSKVAHGRYTEGELTELEERAIRSEFEDLVCRSAARFREIGRREGWQADNDLRKWEERLELG